MTNTGVFSPDISMLTIDPFDDAVLRDPVPFYAVKDVRILLFPAREQGARDDGCGWPVSDAIRFLSS